MCQARVNVCPARVKVCRARAKVCPARTLKKLSYFSTFVPPGWQMRGKAANIVGGEGSSARPDAMCALPKAMCA
jgi:hypothetical protein